MFDDKDPITWKFFFVIYLASITTLNHVEEPDVAKRMHVGSKVDMIVDDVVELRKILLKKTYA